MQSAFRQAPSGSLTSAGKRLGEPQPAPATKTPLIALLLVAVVLTGLVLLGVAYASWDIIFAPPQNASTTATATTVATTTSTQQTVTTQTTTTATLTTTSQKATTTTQKPKPTTTTTTTTTTTLSQTSTTVQAKKACTITADCGGPKTFLVCKDNIKIVQVTETYQCASYLGGSACLAKQRMQTLSECGSGKLCYDGKCGPPTTTTTIKQSSATSTLRFFMPTTTTTIVIPAATKCSGRSENGQARSSSDCESLPCGTVVGGIPRTCTFIEDDPGIGHCTCK